MTVLHRRRKNFNPHSHEGSDPLAKMITQEINHFNPHSHEGSDEPVIYEAVIYHRFQSTLPRRERPKLDDYQDAFINFNPHSHEGSDTTCLCAYIKGGISIHTPTKGATIIIDRGKK